MTGYCKTLVLLLALCPLGANAAGCFTYEAPRSSLTGVLARVHIDMLSSGMRPHPVTVTQWVLYTSQPFCVKGDVADGDIPVAGATNVQLLPMHNEPELLPLIGKTVTVVGPFMATLIPHYHPYLIMQVFSVSGSVGAEP